MRLRLVSSGIAIVAVLVACVGDDPAITGPGVGPGADGGADGKALGEACSPTDRCASGTCADGVCCDKACTGTCEACDATGHCGATKGKPKHGTCDGDATGPCAGSCDGTNSAACTYPTVACGAPASCAANIATLPAACKAGTCGATSTQTCALGCFADGCLGVTQVAAGYSFACAALSDKKVRCWGDNSTGQVGQGAGDSTAVYRKPTEVPNLTGVKAMAATFGTACALMDDGTVRCWGSNTGGGLGLGTTDNVKHDVAAVPGIAGATFLAGSSGGHFCAIVAGGALKCWGGNGGGQVGDGTVATPKAPTSVCQPGSTTVPCTPATGVTFVAGGDNHTCATFAGGQVACWGRNDVGQLGQTADAVPHPFPKNVPGLTATYLTAGNQLSCAASGGGAKCWGGVVTGILGHGQNVGAAAAPVAVCTKQDCSTLLTGVTAVSNYDVSACALASGAVKCWGDNTGGQLGDGNATSAQNFAGSTAIGAGAVQITAGGQTNYAIVVDRANRDIRCWGADFVGECGDNAPAVSSHKVPVAPAW